jgi:methylated-DNA-protein-cysteine methyltransferase-like protein
MPYDAERHGPRRVVGPGFHELVYTVVTTVPRGRVTTYGDIAARLGLRSAARLVGYALAALPADRDDVPWHRVVNGQGRLAARSDGWQSGEQRRRLVADGCAVDPTGRIEHFAARRHVFSVQESRRGSVNRRRT